MTWQSSQAQLVEIPSGFNSGGLLGLAWTHRPKAPDSVLLRSPPLQAHPLPGFPDWPKLSFSPPGRGEIRSAEVAQPALLIWIMRPLALRGTAHGLGPSFACVQLVLG
ncbi:hypothetical protein PCANC_01652 [Puccinia coronata f. sp. avenae]|uniref:Uncharacterized protein n=1 Tax=Puccinia coronata f. sp. avenae TaxID=200324 RepID=A0A2N5W3B3_9BASI|nr:hypothetical protein PCANC_01652 [Puccinia coronata f. sp. avenae]